MQTTQAGIDIAKSVFEVALSETPGTVRLLHPGDVARYRDGDETDRADAKAVLEAARNAALDAVPVKSREQHEIAALNRMRQSYLQTRTPRINAVRGHLREFGKRVQSWDEQPMATPRAHHQGEADAPITNASSPGTSNR